MVLGLKSKSRKVTCVQVDYLVHIQEIKPWPTSEAQSVKSAHSVVLQWQNGDQVSGSFVSAVGDGKVEFDQSFKLPVTLYREEKSKSRESFQKNLLEIYLYEPPNDKEKKGQIVGTSMINLAEYGIIEETISISSPVSCKKSFRNATQPVIFVRIQPLDRESSSSSPLASSSKAASFDMEGSKLLSEIMSNEGEVEIESFTDDDDCLSSTRTIPPASEGSVGAPQKEESAKETNHGESIQHSRDGSEKANEVCEPEHQSGSYSAADSSSQAVDYAENRKTTRTFTTRFEQESMFDEKDYEDEQQNLVEMKLAVQNLLKNIPQGAKEKKTTRRTNTLTISNRSSRVQGSTVQSHKLKHLKSVQIPLNSVKRNDAMGNHQNNEEAGTSNVQENSSGNKKGTAKSEGNGTSNGSSDNKNELKSRIDMLEEELREAAAVEVGLYSIISEHGSSINKVHAPARRLSRFYLHAYKSGSASRRASAARAIISGLILVSKACGNDVPRLTFWFSNSIALRAILAADGMPLFAEPGIKRNGSGKNSSKKLPRGWTKSYLAKKTKDDSQESSDNWEDPKTFAFALENFESWVFSRTVESVWWQTLTPHMQSAAAKGSSSKKSNGKKPGLRDQQQGNFSIDLWKKAFKDACERLCPLRAGGHECGCLPLLAKLVMEQLVVRLDVAMFNAILRESADDMPTDPVSDPISDPKVLPIPAGKSSFGAGVQLKNAIGSWSRWLTDLFSIDDTDQPEDAQEPSDQGKPENGTSFKAFHLLNSLSDLMMLPLEMLSDISTRKEVCPTFSAPLIKRILNNFVPDEFSPDPVPASVFKALEAEESDDVAEEFMTSFPISATSILYLPPSAASLAEIMGETGSQTGNRSSVLKKSYTSDDELDELDSPMTLINMRNLRDPASSKKTSSTLNACGGRNVIRYKLLREVWRDNE